MPDFDGPRKMPVHGTRGATGSEGCLLLYSVVGNSLIFPISFALLAKFEAGKSGRNAIFTASQPEFFRQRTAAQQDADGVFRAIRAASPGVHRCVPTHCRCFPRNPGGESGGVVLHSTALPAFSGKHRGNPAPTPGLSVAILCPRQD